MFKILIKPTDKIIEIDENTNVMDSLLHNNINMDNNCLGHGTCGKCKVKLLSGNVNPITKQELSLLSKYDMENSIRLSCFLFPKSDITIELAQQNNDEMSITAFGFLPEFSLGTPSLNKEYNPANNSTLVKYNKTIISTEKGNTSDNIFGIALDIGTTTVVMSLVNILTKQEISTEVSINTQVKYGQDVITRISYSNDNGEIGITSLKNEIISLINNMINEICAKSNINSDNIYEIAVSANTTMLHMLLGISAFSLAHSPYKPVFTNAQTTNAYKLGININSKGILYCLPSISAFVGADIVSGIYASNFYKASGNSLFIDIGTNSEIVLNSNGSLYCCSCAAGPALEGMNISCGVKACTGAIEEITVNNDEIIIKTIGNSAPIGLCGSGIISSIGQLVKNRIIKNNGQIRKHSEYKESDLFFQFAQDRLSADNKTICIADSNPPINITQKDIRQVQLAKGAILAGIHSLLETSEIDFTQIDKVFIAGQFGLHLSAKSLVECDIIPEILSDKIIYVGNTSKSGAILALLSYEAKQIMSNIAASAKYIELSTLNTYQEKFIKCLNFNSDL